MIINNYSKDWQEVKLKDICEIKTGSTNVEDSIIDGKYPLFDRSAIIKKSNNYLFDCEAIIIPGEGQEFTPKYYCGKFDLHQRAYAIWSKSNVHMPYLYFFLDNNKINFYNNAVGSTVKSLRRWMFDNLKILIPKDPKEQTAIAQILTSVDNTIQKTDELIKQTEILKKGLMSELLTKGINHKKFKQTELGEIPVEWEIKKIKDFAKIQGGFSFKSEDYITDGVPIIKINNVSYSFLDSSELSYLPNEHINTYKDFIIFKNDILLALTRPIISGGLKYCKFNLEGKYLLNQRVGRITIKDKEVSNEYLYSFIGSDRFYADINSRITASNQPNVSTKDLETIKIPIPPLPEQQQISGILSTIDKEIDELKVKKSYYNALKKGLMSDLLSGKVRVKVN